MVQPRQPWLARPVAAVADPVVPAQAQVVSRWAAVVRALAVAAQALVAWVVLVPAAARAAVAGRKWPAHWLRELAVAEPAATGLPSLAVARADRRGLSVERP
jgi:hypothetical protein